MLPAEISDKTSLADSFVPGLLLALFVVVLCRIGWGGRVAAVSLAFGWVLMVGLELSDREFVLAARLEFGWWYEGSLVASALIPILGILISSWTSGSGGGTAPKTRAGPESAL